MPTSVFSNLEIAENGITFFETWISRLGGLVAFIGAVKFALATKSDDAKEQLLAILTMISGFMICDAVGDLSVFDIPSYYGEYTANAEFQSILKFIGKWTRRVGAMGLLIGAIMFGLSVKDNNAATKITALKTIVAGAMVAALSGVLPLFIS